MSTVFADSSAVVKRYVDEPGHDVVRRDANLVLSTLTRVEVPSAFWRKRRAGELSQPATLALIGAFEADWYGDGSNDPVFSLIDIGTDLLGRAATLVGRHDLHAADAIQLACAGAARHADPDCTTLACFDERLRDAAAIEGFTLLPVA